MSDAPGRGATAPLGGAAAAGATVPLAARPAQAGGGNHRATQVSQAAAPSTLASPKALPVLMGGATIEDGPGGAAALPVGIDGVLNGSTLRDDAAREAAMREIAERAHAQADAMPGEPSARRHGPATMMSPMPGAGGSAPGAPALAPEHAVVDAILPAAAFSPPAGGSGGAFGMGNAPPHELGGNHQEWGAPGAHAGAFDARDPRQAAAGGHPGPIGTLPPPGQAPRARAPRRSHTTLIVGLVAGAVVLLLAVVAVAGGAFFLTRRAAATRAAKASQDEGEAPPAFPAAPGPVSTPEAPSRAMGGTKARITALTTGALALETVRAALNVVLPRVDGCFAASELEPPNHENAAYDLEVAASGAVSRVEPASPIARASKLDACVAGVLRTARLPRSPGGSRVKVILTARIGDPQLPR